MDTLRPFEVKVRRSARHKVQTWMRFHSSEEEAQASARAAVRYEFGARGIVESVTDITEEV